MPTLGLVGSSVATTGRAVGVPFTSLWLVAMTAAISSATLLGSSVVGVQAVKTVASATPAAVTMAKWRRASPITLKMPPRGTAAGWEGARDTGRIVHGGDSLSKRGSLSPPQRRATLP